MSCNLSGTDYELHGIPVLCPGSSIIFKCQTNNTDSLIWRVNDTNILIPGNHNRCDGNITKSGNVAYLKELNILNGTIGNRISLLELPSNVTSDITVQCIGGSQRITCNWIHHLPR